MGSVGAFAKMASINDRSLTLLTLAPANHLRNKLLQMASLGIAPENQIDDTVLSKITLGFGKVIDRLEREGRE